MSRHRVRVAVPLALSLALVGAPVAWGADTSGGVARADDAVSSSSGPGSGEPAGDGDEGEGPEALSA